jgi:hypothetical protein
VSVRVSETYSICDGAVVITRISVASVGHGGIAIVERESFSAAFAMTVKRLGEAFRRAGVSVQRATASMERFRQALSQYKSLSAQSSTQSPPATD